MKYKSLGMRLRRMLSTLLCAAMVVTELSVPTYAAGVQQDDTLYEETEDAVAEEVSEEEVTEEVTGEDERDGGQEEVEASEVNSTEYITNGDFSAGAGWNGDYTAYDGFTINSGVWSVYKDENFWKESSAGVSSALGLWSNEALTYQDAELYQEVTLPAGTYKVSARFKSNSGSPKAKVFAGDNASDATSFDSSDFTTISKTFTLDAETTLNAGFAITETVASGSIYVTDVSLTEYSTFTAETLKKLLDSESGVTVIGKDNVTVKDIATVTATDADYYKASLADKYLSALKDAQDAYADYEASSKTESELETYYDALVAAMEALEKRVDRSVSGDYIYDGSTEDADGYYWSYYETSGGGKIYYNDENPYKGNYNFSIGAAQGVENSLWQNIESLPKGKYTISAYVNNNWNNSGAVSGTVKLFVDSYMSDALTYSYDSYDKIEYTFETNEDLPNIDAGIQITTTDTSDWFRIDCISLTAAAEYSLEDLAKLVSGDTEAEEGLSVKTISANLAEDENYYTEESFGTYETAYLAAKKLVDDNDDSDADAIINAYKALVKAMQDLEEYVDWSVSGDYIVDGGCEEGSGSYWTFDKGSSDDSIYYTDGNPKSGSRNFSIGVNSTEKATLSQVIKSLPKGKYTISAYVNNNWNGSGAANGSVTLFAGDNSQEFTSFSYGSYGILEYSFEVTENLTNVSAGIAITSNETNNWYRVDDISLVAAADITLAELEKLVNGETTPTGADSTAAISVNVAGKEDYYTEETYSDYENALKAAKDVVAKGDETDTEGIQKAYDDLVSAMRGLERNIASTTITLYYYDEKNDLTSLKVMAYGSQAVIKNSDFFVAAEDAGDYWYKTSLTFLETAGGQSDADGFNICDEGWDNTVMQIAHQGGWSSYPAIYDKIVSMKDGESIYIKNYKAYDTLEETESITLAMLKELIAEADLYVEEEYTEKSFGELKKALVSGNAIVTAIEVDGDAESDYESDIAVVYRAIEAAILALEAKEDPGINVKPVALSDNFITGADLSSYLAIRDSGVTFKDENGNAMTDEEFFRYMKEGGTNWIRIRIWNDPYDASGRGYGGGNNDIEKAVELGKLAQQAGMKILIDFHYSDFWADPSKYKAPKAWANYTNSEKAEAVYDFTYESLETLYKAGVNDIYMVQVGNESNHGLAGETDEDATKLYGYGCDAVHDSEALFGHHIDAAIHLTDVQNGGGTVTSGLSRQVVSNQYTDRNGDTHYVNYDAVGVSYYPLYRHGDIANLQEVMNNLKANYGPGGTATKVYVAETAWTYTWADGDGFSNSGPSLTGQDIDLYSISVQGQADELRDVVNAVNNIGDSGLGVFYWEPAWLSPYRACYDDYSVDEELYAKNEALWAKYGSGWASEYSYEYDPTNAGIYYGGVAVDNQAWFDFDGKALPTSKIYSLIRTGAVDADKNKLISVQENQLLTLSVGDDLEDALMGLTIKGQVNDGTEIELENVKWNKDEIEKVDTDKVGTYVIFGQASAPAEYGSTVYQIRATVEITANNNALLENGDFEAGSKIDSNNYKFDYWEVYAVDDVDDAYVTYPNFSYTGNVMSIEKNNARGSSSGALNFWHGDKPLNIHVYQKVGNIEPGNYTFGGYFEGGSAGEYDQQYAVAYVYDDEEAFKADLLATEENPKSHPLGTDAAKKYKDSEQFEGWLSWKNPEVSNVVVESRDQYVIVGFEFYGTPAGAWGSVDDAYMYGNYDVVVEDGANGSLKSSNYKPGTYQTVKLTAQPDTGYVVKSITISANDIADYVPDGWTVSSDGVHASYIVSDEEQGLTAVTAEFMMPKNAVIASAEFAGIFESGAIDVSQVSVNTIGGVSYNDGRQKFYATGKRVQPDVVLSYKNYVLTTKDYTLLYRNSVNPGEATVTVTGKGNFTGSKELTYTLVSDERTDISNASISWNGAYRVKGASAEYFYTGEDVEPEVSLVVNGQVVPREAYTLSYYKNDKLGSANLYATAKGSQYSGSLQKKFKIVAADLSVLVSPTDAYADMTPIVINGNNTIADVDYMPGSLKPSINIWYGTQNLRRGRDYTVTYKNVKKISADGQKLSTVVIKGTKNYKGSVSLSYAVKAKDIADKDLYFVADDMLQGKGLKAPVINGFYTANSKLLVKKKNFDIVSVTCPDGSLAADGRIPTDTAGTYQVLIKGKGFYRGSRVLEVNVVDADHFINKSSIKLGKIYYQGKAITLKNGGIKLVSTMDGKLAANSMRVTTASKKTVLTESNLEAYKYENNYAAGKATMWLRATGTDGEGKPYAGKVKVEFNIKKLTLVSQAKYAELMGRASNTDGAVGYATIAGDISYVRDHMKEDTTYGVEQFYTGYDLTPEYELCVSANGLAGTSTVTINKDYKAVFKNNKKASVTATDGVAYGKAKYVAGTGAKVSFNGTGNYTGHVGFDDVFFIHPRTVDDLDVVIDTATFDKTKGEAEVIFTDLEYGVRVFPKKGMAYSVKYKSHKFVMGIYKLLGIENDLAPEIVVTIKGDLKSKDSSKNVIRAKYSINASKILVTSVEDIKPQKYKDGKAVKPKMNVTVDGHKLKEGRDYVVTYTHNCSRYSTTDENDEMAPRATVTGIGNYTGTVEKIFTIE